MLPLRKLIVDGENYLWRVRPYYNRYNGAAKLMIYLAANKNNKLEVFLSESQLSTHFPRLFKENVIYKWTGEKGLPEIHQPVMVVRIIRYAKRQLGWLQSQENNFITIHDGYGLLKDMGYIPENEWQAGVDTTDKD